VALDVKYSCKKMEDREISVDVLNHDAVHVSRTAYHPVRAP
jgi:hypothetical protein